MTVKILVRSEAQLKEERSLFQTMIENIRNAVEDIKGNAHVQHRDEYTSVGHFEPYKFWRFTRQRREVDCRIQDPYLHGMTFAEFYEDKAMCASVHTTELLSLVEEQLSEFGSRVSLQNIEIYLPTQKGD